MMRLLFLLLWSMACLRLCAQQPLPQAALQQLSADEAVLQKLGHQMIFDYEATRRFEADSSFIRRLVQALRVPHSFAYPFDSLETVSRVYAPDSSFRIFTWQFQRSEDYYRQRGAIQVNTPDGSLKLFPLIDMSDFSLHPVDSVRSNLNWIGAIYYKIILKSGNGKKYYTLLGLDDNNLRSTKKWIDVLSFDEAGQPHFGGQLFNYKNDSLKPAQPAYRFCLEFKKDGRARLNYDPEMDMIIFEHLVSESNDLSKKYTLIPDGDYEGFKWQKDHWEHVDKVFTYQLGDGDFPMPAPIKDASGKNDEQKLMEQSIRNMQKGKQPSAQQKKLQQNQRTDPRKGEEY